jgi:hypothetical protein
MPHHLTIPVVASLATLAAASAFACSPPEEDRPVVTPDPAAGAELAVDAFLYLEERTDSHLAGRSWSSDPWGSSSLLMHPDNSPVEWEVTVSDFSDEVSQAQPVGGWQVGEYWAGTEEASWIVYTVVDVVDEAPPELSIVGWSGVSYHPELPAPCSGSSGDPSGIELELGPISEPFVLTWELLDEDGEVVEEGAKFFTDPATLTPFLPVPTGSTGELRLEAIDLSGNRASASTTDVVACDGCSGSLSASPSKSLWVLGLLPLAAMRRRRNSQSS